MSAPKKVVTASSTKSDIIDAASEIISTQDDELNSKSKMLLSLEEEKQSITYLLIATSIYGLLF